MTDGSSVGSDRWQGGGYTRACDKCGHRWAVEHHHFGDEMVPDCPQCGHGPKPGEKVWDSKTCPGCGKDVSGPNPPVEGFPGQRYCSVECAGMITDGGQSVAPGTERIKDTEIVPREELEQTGNIEGVPVYACPRCDYQWITEDCDCPECGWAGMCQEDWS